MEIRIKNSEIEFIANVQFVELICLILNKLNVNRC